MPAVFEVTYEGCIVFLRQVRLLKTRNIKCIIGGRLSSVVSQKLWKVCFRQAIIGAELQCNAWLSYTVFLQISSSTARPRIALECR